jgi:hypothetical protein
LEVLRAAHAGCACVDQVHQFQEGRTLRRSQPAKDPWLFGRTQHCSRVTASLGLIAWTRCTNFRKDARCAGANLQRTPGCLEGHDIAPVCAQQREPRRLQAAAAVGMTIKIQAKVCSACKHKLPWADFSGSQWQASHHHRHCKTCAKKQRLTLNARGRGRLPSKVKCSGDVPPRTPRHGESAILVREPFATLIIQGKKTMEVRGVATSKRERVWIVSIDTRRILGDVCIVACTRFQKHDAATLYDQHQIPESVFNTMSYRKYFGYILAKPTPLNVAVFHKTYPGPQSFVHLKLVQ